MPLLDSEFNWRCESLELEVSGIENVKNQPVHRIKDLLYRVGVHARCNKTIRPFFKRKFSIVRPISCC